MTKLMQPISLAFGSFIIAVVEFIRYTLPLGETKVLGEGICLRLILRRMSVSKTQLQAK